MTPAPGYFVTGTDTAIGKTVVTAALIAGLRARGIPAVPMKPVQTGCPSGAAGDLDRALDAAGIPPAPVLRSLLNPYCFPLAASPHLAAREQGVRIDAKTIQSACHELRMRDLVPVVEGAGGLLVPLNESTSMIDLIALLGLPVVLVARAGLGTLNHTLLSVAALRQQRQPIAAVILNSGLDPWGDVEEDNLSELQRRLPGIPVQRFPHLRMDDLSAVRRAGVELLAGLAAPHEHAPATAAQIRMWDQAHVWHPYTRTSTLQGEDLPVIVRGEGIHLVDVSGRRYVDAISSWWCASLGHSEPRLVSAIQAQASVLQHSILANLTHPQAAELAARLAALMPTPDRHVLFASDGASAVEQALKIAVQYAANTGRPQQRRFACLHGAYHGDTLGAMGVGYLEEWHRPFRPLLADALVLPFPSAGESFAAWEHALTPHVAELAAVIVEPLCLGAAGMRMYPPALLRQLADWCRDHQVLLIDDEIAMGFGRTGRWFAFEHADIDPDVVCVGKALTGGTLPMSATIAKDFLYATFTDRPSDHTLQHGHTFCGNPVAAAVANEALRVYAERDLPGRAARLGAQLAAQIEPLRGRRGIRDVRTLGLIGAVELEPEETPDTISRPHRIRRRLQADGILLRPLGNVLYLMPPLIITEEELTSLSGRLISAITAELG